MKEILNVALLNRRIVRVGRDFWRSFGPMTLPRQDHPGQITQELVQVGFVCLQRETP